MTGVQTCALPILKTEAENVKIADKKLLEIANNLEKKAKNLRVEFRDRKSVV